MKKFLSDGAYASLKFIALIALPALATAYIAFGNLWELPKTEAVGASIMILDGLLGGLLQISTSRYNNSSLSHDGFLAANGVDPDTGIPNLQMTITKTPDEILQGKTVRLKVGNPG